MGDNDPGLVPFINQPRDRHAHQVNERDPEHKLRAGEKAEIHRRERKRN